MPLAILAGLPWSFLAITTSSIFFGILITPIVHNLSLPPDYPHRKSEHPSISPHIPPSTYHLSSDQIQSFRRDGMVILRNVLPPDIAHNMDIAGHDLVRNATRQCEMTRFTGPLLFHGYHRYCGRAQLVHDYLRDVVYKSPLAYVAAQLIGTADAAGSDDDDEKEKEEQPILRQIADTFMAGERIPKRWHSDYLSFANFASDDSSNAAHCQNGVVLWLPMQDTAEESNGMIFINGSSSHFEQHFGDSSTSMITAADNRSHDDPNDFFSYMKWLGALPKNDYVAPRVALGDAIAFDACTVHSSSGLHREGGGIRRAYQLRFLKDFDLNPPKEEKESEMVQAVVVSIVRGLAGCITAALATNVEGGGRCAKESRSHHLHSHRLDQTTGEGTGLYSPVVYVSPSDQNVW
eukprot:CAMPEP_0178619004 /NCGR_PEP_ID=MMETSP0698-20121128/4537_1 /TAXON_ID=265572 /ORGANISM="Extubocellulus spinifer, Strain CCMP396" /LENGTH=405 /DNA_ID=CAMNT_0020257919 /DNA_START=206 /DNA_END=1419 /DNA_ORIENTATION=+